VDICLEHQVEGGRLAGLHLFEDVLQPRSAAASAGGACQARLTLPVLAGFRHLACGLLVWCHDEQVA